MNMVQVYDSSKAWPYVEAKRVLKHIERKGKKPGDTVTFETGYGPSGAPHIGTFAEVVRTLWVMKAFDDLTQNAYNTRLIMFSDDYDAMRKVPDGMPEWMNDHLGKPLTHVPNPYGENETAASFGAANNERLVTFVNNILAIYDGSKVHNLLEGQRVSCVSSSEFYWTGAFDGMLARIWNNYEAIQAIMLPSLGEERRETYSPFMPVTHTSQVVDRGVRLSDTQGWIEYCLPDEPEDYIRTNIYGGNVKLQWKVDWAMRWVHFDVDYEMSGKDLTESVRLSSQICRVLGGTPPVNLTYELFLDKDGAKISKSKGNGFTIEEWLRYGTQESLAYFLYREPTRAKNLHPGVVPIAMHDYNHSLTLYRGQTVEQQLGNPVHHIHNGNVVAEPIEVTYSLLLNLVGSTGITDPEVVSKIVDQYRGEQPKVQQLIPLVCRYFEDYLSDSIEFRPPTAEEARQLIQMIEGFRTLEEPTAESIQAVVYEIGKAHNYEKLQEWFKVIYEVVFGSSQGPRVGTFAAMVGIDQFIEMVEGKLNV